MSRGVGPFQVRVLETLAVYEGLGPALCWAWPAPRSRYSLAAIYTTPEDISQYERGRRIPCWIVRRDLACSRDRLSRAVRALRDRGLVYGYTGDLSDFGRAVKYLQLSREGRTWLDKRQQRHSANVGGYPQTGTPSDPVYQQVNAHD